MVASGPVGIKTQTFLGIIPYVNIWAFYRIQKLRKLILLSLGLGAVFLPLHFLVLGSLNISNLGNPLDIYLNPIFMSYLILSFSTQLSLEVFFIRRWTRKWNQNFDS